jgi:hypothetical protein
VNDTEAQSALGENRRLITALSVLTGALGLIPVPLVGDLGIDLVRAALLRRLARRRKAELSRHAALVLCGVQQVSVGRLAISTALIVAMRYAWRRLTRTLLVLLRFDDMGRTFLLATIFDYYCARHHPPETEISVERAEVVRRAIAAASSGVREHVFSALFQRAFTDLVRAGLFLPRTLWVMATSALRDEKAEEVERVVEEDLEGFFARATRLVEQELAAAGQDVLSSLCTAFDAAWARETPAGGPETAQTTTGPGASA